MIIRRPKKDDIFGMANLTCRKTGLSADIWSDHKGIERQVSHSNTPRIKITTKNGSASLTIEPNPVIKAKSRHLKKSDIDAINEAKDYVGRNYDLFLKHYYDVDDVFDDEDLFQALRERGEYK